MEKTNDSMPNKKSKAKAPKKFNRKLAASTDLNEIY